jgi:hypothetical protein
MVKNIPGKLLVLYSVFLLSIFFPSLVLGGIKGSKHDLSITGGGSVKAVDEKQICIFCHTPHNSQPAYPLWNHEISAVTNYKHYISDTLQSYTNEAEAPPIDGISKLCLSCHDGTVGVGSVSSRSDEILLELSPCIDASGKLIEAIDCTGYIGTDLSGGHPVSIVFDEALKIKREQATELCPLNWPIIDSDVKLYPTNGPGLRGVQCSSCHDPHTNKATSGWPPFWQKAEHDMVCEVCHISCTRAWPW